MDFLVKTFLGKKIHWSAVPWNGFPWKKNSLLCRITQFYNEHINIKVFHMLYFMLFCYIPYKFFSPLSEIQLNYLCYAMFRKEREQKHEREKKNLCCERLFR
jgi:hypothetical protein